MRYHRISKVVAMAAVVRRSASFSLPMATAFHPSAAAMASTTFQHPTNALSRMYMSSGGETMSIKHVGYEEMDAILDDYEETGRGESGMIVLDVRNTDEVAATGKLSPNTHTVPLPAIMQYNLFQLDEDEFEEICGFAKPTPDETIVLSCAAGIRSMKAAKFISDAGYTKLVNYMGGANEWFNR